MSFIDSVVGWWKSEQTNWALINVIAPNVPQLPGALPDGTGINPDQAYVTAKMRSMAVMATRQGWNLFHAALYTQVSLALRNGEQATIESVLSPDFLRNLDPNRLQNVLQIDRTIFGPVPYIGTKIGFQTGVFAVKHADLAGPFLTSLTDLASVAGVGLVSAAKPFIEPIKNGVELLTGTKDATSLEIALSRDLQPPQTGWYALIRQAASSVNASEFAVRSNNFELLRKGQPIPGVPYLLFSIEGHTLRSDWAQIPDLKAAYADFIKAVNDNKQNDAQAAVNLFARRAKVSPELLPTHADDLATALHSELKRVFRGGATATAVVGGIPSDLSKLAVTFRTPQ